MAGSSSDARLKELELLSEIDRNGKMLISPTGVALRDLVAYLVSEGLLGDPSLKWDHSEENRFDGLPGESDLERQINRAKLTLLSKVLGNQPVECHVTHRGRVRLSELKQALRGGREREPFGILWDVRHWECDAQIAILEASASSPLSLAYLDMNGLKQINDAHGHDAGDLALKAYFHSVASVLGDGGQAYRLSGGADEVVVLLPNRNEQAAVQIMQLACSKLMGERLWPMDPKALLSISIGIVVVTDAQASSQTVRGTADLEQKRAKTESKKSDPRPSVIAVAGRDELIVIKHQEVQSPIKVSGFAFQEIGDVCGFGFHVENRGSESLPPFKIALFHPKVGTFFLFPSDKSGPLLQDQRRDFKCRIRKGDPMVRFEKDVEGNPLTEEDNAEFEFRLVLDDSDKVLYANKRIGRGAVKLLRRAVADGSAGGGTWDEWNELSNSLPDE